MCYISLDWASGSNEIWNNTFQSLFELICIIQFHIMFIFSFSYILQYLNAVNLITRFIKWLHKSYQKCNVYVHFVDDSLSVVSGNRYYGKNYARSNPTEATKSHKKWSESDHIKLIWSLICFKSLILLNLIDVDFANELTVYIIYQCKNTLKSSYWDISHVTMKGCYFNVLLYQ